MKFICFLAAILASPAIAAAQGGSCEELRFQRNAIFKREGYCFKTPDMIRAFGNAGCRYGDQRDVPLSERDRSEIDSITRLEHTLGCR